MQVRPSTWRHKHLLSLSCLEALHPILELLLVHLALFFIAGFLDHVDGVFPPRTSGRDLEEGMADEEGAADLVRDPLDLARPKGSRRQSSLESAKARK